MSMLLSRLVSWGLVSLLGLGILATLIWYYGPLLSFGDWAPLAPALNRVIVIVSLFLLWGLVRIFKAWRDRRKSAEISNDLAASADSMDPNQEQSAEEMAELRDRFDDALKTLRKSSVGGKKIRSIYQLPWYIIIGPPGSGKTTLLVNSGLQFPLAEAMGEQKIQGVGGTRYCDWWFTDEAVLIDTAGRYTTQDSNRDVDNAAWTGFLNLLKKHRRRRPINGIILAISLEELMRQSEHDRERNARAISDRIQELYDRLGVRFPIYLMFTKCDLMAGFMEFYGDFDRRDREQVWGFTLGLNDDPLQTFPVEYERLQQELENRLTRRLHEERDVARRELIYNFPIQFSSTRDAVEEFMQRVFKTSRYKQTPLLRGVYFTSGTQEGTPFNRIMSQLASNFSLSRAATQSRPSRGKSYFISDLMQKVIFGESGIAGANLKAERLYRMARRGGYALLIALPILLTVAWWWSHSENKELIEAVSASTVTINETIEDVRPTDPSLEHVLPLLNEARTLPLGYHAQGESVPIGQTWGLYQGNSLGERGTVKAYQRVLENAFLPRLMVDLERDLREAGNDSDRVYQALKTYLMLDPVRDRMDADHVKAYFHQEWDQELSRQLSTDQLDQLHAHLDALLDIQPLRVPFQHDENLISNARVLLQQTTIAERIYKGIRGRYINEGEPNSIYTMAGASSTQVFQRASGATNLEGVPEFFSRSGYENMYLPAEQEAVDLVEEEAWVFATEASDAAGISEIDLKNELRRAYLADYTRQWEAFLEDIRITPFSGFGQAASILQILSKNPSPLRELINNASQAMRLVPDESLQQGDDGPSWTERASELLNFNTPDGLMDPAIVDQEFASFHALAAGGDGGSNVLEGLLSDLANLWLYMDQLASKDSSQLLEDMQGGANTALNKVRASGQRADSPVTGWVLNVVDGSETLISGGATRAMRLAWSSEVAPFCRRALNGRYPFVQDDFKEVRLQDFGDFFSPGGRLDAFFQTYLAGVLDTSSQRLRVRPGLENRVKLSAASLRQIEIARNIQNAFFRGGGSMPAVSFELRPVRLDPNTTNFMLSINGQTTTYGHGPIFPETFEWPGDSGLNQVTYQFVPTPPSGSGDSTDGQWAWFRMLDKTGLQAGPQPETFITRFERDDRWAEYQVRANSAYNPFNLDELRSFRCPDQL